MRIALVLALTACTDAPSDTPTDYDPVRFAVIGDWGEGNTAQQEVADVLARVCTDQGCDVVLSTGDNFYDVGVTAEDDALFEERWTSVYADVDSTWLMSLGNHDYGGLGRDWDRATHQLAFEHPRWHLPDHFYKHSLQNVDFLAIDTNWLMWWSEFQADAEAMGTAFDGFVRDSASDHWVIPFGHHPILSNGQHGDAGSYDRLEGIPNLAGIELRAWMDQHLCGRSDVYFSGHDHDRQWQTETCDGTELIVSGAGAKLRPFREEVASRELHFGEDQIEGFVWVEIDDDTMRLEWWNRDGVLEDTGELTRPAL